MNETKDWQIYRDLAMILTAWAQKLYKDSIISVSGWMSWSMPSTQHHRSLYETLSVGRIP